MKDTYIAVYNETEKMGVFKFENSNNVGTHFFDTMVDNGYTIKSISEEEYNACDIGDEISIEDLRDGNYTIE